jgi:metallo-beta-lactamase family protein
MGNPGRKRRANNNDRRIRLHFLGATRTVTGSLHFFEISEAGRTVRFFLDAGLNQESSGLNFQNRLPAGVKANEVDFGIFSHTHIDHTGFFPRLVKDGFKGVVYATHATRDLASVLLPDSGFLQEEEAKRASRRAERKRTPAAKVPAATKRGAGAKRAAAKKDVAAAEEKPRVIQPLYTEADARASLKQIVGVDYDKPLTICEGVVVRFSHASHLLGAAVVSLELGTGSKKRRVVFSGDLGRPDMPVLKDLAVVKQADYLICEGTYGDKLHERRDRLTAFAEIINRAYERAKVPDKKYGHGVIVIPAFAVGRVQSVLYDLRQLMAEKRIPEIPVFVDSPMAIRATAIYRQYSDLYNRDAKRVADGGTDLFRTPRYAELTEWAQSERLDEPATEPTIVVGSSGMASGGRIVRHLQNRLPGKQNTVVFIGYQGEGTLGRQIVTPEVTEVKVAGTPVRVRATVEYMKDYSGHADYEDIIRWLSAFQRKPTKMFLVHGEAESLDALKTRIEERLRWTVAVPKHREYIDLE